MLIELSHTKRIIWLLVLWQFISVLLMALGTWPASIAWINVAMLGLFVLVVPPYEGLLMLILSIPFYVALPNRYLDSLPMWRLLFIEFFAVWFVHLAIKQKSYWQKLFTERKKQKPNFRKILLSVFRRIDSRFLPWDKYIWMFLALASVSSFFARFPWQGIKQIIFFINIYLFYIVFINVVTTKDKIIEVVKYLVVSTGIIVVLGYIQFAATLFVVQYYFWQYWAIMVSKLYYGLHLASVLAYSNSWFSYSGGQQTLRMFSIMPDSHSFAMIAALFIGFALPLVFFTGPLYRKAKNLLLKPFTKTYFLWTAIRFTGLAIILSGTRGMWVGMILPLIVSIWLYAKKIVKPLAKKALISFLLILLFFALSPFINTGLNWFRLTYFRENFLQRVSSIYDLQEESNVGRLIIWQNSLKYSVGHPFGVGYGNFIVSLVPEIPSNATFGQVAEQKNLRYNLPQKFVSAHSLFLNLLVEMGFFGVLIFGLFSFEILWIMWHFLRKQAREVNFYTMTVLSAGLTWLWFLGYSVFDVTIFNDRVLIYSLIGLGIAGIITKRYESFKKD